jgi:hypothetical protein
LATAKRHWVFARAWLYRYITKANKVKTMKTSLLFRKIDSFIFAAAFSLAAVYSVKSDWCNAIGFSRPDVVVVENEPFARITLYRSSDTNLVQTVDYLTFGGKPGMDYVPSSGTATFAVGQEATNVDIPLIDNGLLDGFRDFHIVLTNRSPGLFAGPDFPWVRIEDNEIGSGVDPFVRIGSWRRAVLRLQLQVCRCRHA